MGRDFKNLQTWTGNFSYLSDRYGSCDLYDGLPCYYVVPILRKLISLLEADGCNHEPPAAAPLPCPMDAGWGWTMVATRALVYVRRKDPSIFARARVVRQLRGLSFNCEFVPPFRYKSMYKTVLRRAITHESLAFRMWRRYVLYLRAALKCNSKYCDCWEEDTADGSRPYNYDLIDEFEKWMAARNTTLVMKTIYK